MQDTPGDAWQPRREHSCRVEGDPLGTAPQGPVAPPNPSTVPPGQRDGLTSRDVSDLSRRGEKERGERGAGGRGGERR